MKRSGSRLVRRRKRRRTPDRPRVRGAHGRGNGAANTRPVGVPRRCHPRERTGQTELIVGENRFGSFDASIDNVHIYGESGASADEMITGQKLVIELEYSIAKHPGSPIFGITILHQDGRACYDASNGRRRSRLPVLTRPGRVAVEYLRSGSGSGHLLY